MWRPGKPTRGGAPAKLSWGSIARVHFCPPSIPHFVRRRSLRVVHPEWCCRFSGWPLGHHGNVYDAPDEITLLLICILKWPYSLNQCLLVTLPIQPHGIWGRF